MAMKVTILMERDGEKREITCDKCYITYTTGNEYGHIWNIAPERLAELLARDKHIRAYWDYLTQAISTLARLVDAMGDGGVKQ